MGAVRTNRVDQGKIPALIQGHVTQFGYPPTQRELADLLGCAVSRAHYHLRALRAKGVVDWETGSQRTLHVVQ